MKRRDFLRSSGAAAATGGVLAGLSQAKGNGPGPVRGPQPNILFILVDELRYPTVFPNGITEPGDFLCAYMPNLFKLWKAGVKFQNYHTAANACTPARGTIITGLYSQQSWLMTTILSKPSPNPLVAALEPVLNPSFPTYGRLLRAAGYSTPYAGKWHVSIPQASTGGLEAYGFDYRTYPDPTGNNLQGTYGSEFATNPPLADTYLNDADTANSAIDFLRGRKPDDSPWCLTVGFVNPHDKEFFPAGTEFKTVTALYESDSTNPTHLKQFINYTTGNPGAQIPWEKNELKSPRSYGYPELPPNWESSQDWKNRNKPTTQEFIKEFQNCVWGGVTDDPNQSTPANRTITPYPVPELNLGTIKMEFPYWQRALDSYTQIMGKVDEQIGRVLCALEDLPASVVENTVVVFTSDHGEYAGAHGLLQGKLGTVYKEAWNVPLIVVDPSGRFTADTDTIRTGLASSVDLLSMLVSFGYKGTEQWMDAQLRQIYGSRLDMIAMLKSASAPGRPYVLHATDEIAPGFFNPMNAPTHVLGIRTEGAKLGVYADWIPATSAIKRRSAQLEFYDYATESGLQELDNTADSDNRVHPLYRQLLRHIIPTELQQPLPGRLFFEQQKSKVAHLIFRALMENFPISLYEAQGSDLSVLLGYGADF